MTDPVWYYARGDVEKGPLSIAQMRALAAAGKIRPEDLVWKEGMETWVPASETADLFPTGTAKTTDKERSAETSEAQTAERRTQWESQQARPAGGLHLNRRHIGQLAALLGFCTALFCRGCDDLADRHVARLQAAVTIAEQRHQAEWDGRQRVLAERMAPIEASAKRTKEQDEQQRQLQAQMSDLQRERERSERYLRETRWNSLKMAAELAEAEGETAAYWRGMTLVLGTLVLTAGLLTMAYSSDGAEHWMSLAALIVLLHATLQRHRVRVVGQVCGVPRFGTGRSHHSTQINHRSKPCRSTSSLPSASSDYRNACFMIRGRTALARFSRPVL